MSVSMKLLLRPIMILATHSNVLTIGDLLPTKRINKLTRLGGVILWDCEGVWGLVTASHVAELARRHAQLKKAKTHYPHTKNAAVSVFFSDTIPVPTAVAKALRG